MYNPVSGADTKVGGGCTPTWKLALQQLVETEKKICSKGIMREGLLKLESRAEYFGAEMTSGSPRH